jgi:hypothetical protein
MQRLWSEDELGEHWTLGAEDLALLSGLPDAGKLGLANHMAAAAAFGLGYSWLRERLPALPAWGLGTLYGAGLYGINIADIAPLIGLTEGEQNAPAPVRAERLGLHILYGVLTACVADGLANGRL